jgi:hypothetical protein
MLRVLHQAKQAVHSGPPPPLVLIVPRGDQLIAPNPRQERNHETLGRV